MKKFIRYTVELIFVISIMGGCILKKRQIEVTPLNILVVEMTDSFEMRIIDYIPGFPCGTFASASNCKGLIIGGDTIRVLTLCNTDTTFKSDQIVKVIPERKPSFNVGVGINIYYDSLGNKMANNPKTIYGKLIKK